MIFTRISMRVKITTKDQKMQRSFDDLPDVLTPADIQQYLPIGRNAVYDLLKTRRIPCTRVGRKILIPKRALRNFLHGPELDAPTP
jgi:excisionase family DNA binding protein